MKLQLSSSKLVLLLNIFFLTLICSKTLAKQNSPISPVNVSIAVQSSEYTKDEEEIKNTIQDYIREESNKLKDLEPASLKINIQTQDSVAKVKMSFDSDDTNPEHTTHFSSFHWSSTKTFNHKSKEQLIERIKFLIDDLFSSLKSSESQLDTMEHNGVDLQEEQRELRRVKPPAIKDKSVNSDRSVWI